MDPRAALLKRSLKTLTESKGDTTLYDMCVAGEAYMKEKKTSIQTLIITQHLFITCSAFLFHFIHRFSLLREQAD